MLGLAKTYATDLFLFNKLGLNTLETNSNDEFKVGDYCDEYGIVEIYVTCLPAQFWRLIIHVNETGSKFELSTGSGGLHNYWDSVEKIMQNMIDIKVL